MERINQQNALQPDLVYENGKNKSYQNKKQKQKKESNLLNGPIQIANHI